MALKTVELNRRIRASRRKNNAFANKRRVSALKVELLDKLKMLESVDRMEIEVADGMAEAFLNLLTNDVTDLYEFEQIDGTHFVFSNKVLDF